MLFCALASDYDGTLAREGRVDEPTLEALRRFKATGKKNVDMRTTADRGAGVAELIDRWLEDPAATFADILRAVVLRGDQKANSFSTGSHAQRLTSNGSIE
jgi:hypothetical protein